MRLSIRLESRRFLRRSHGAAVVEFALVVPILMLIVFAIVDLARAYYTLNYLVTSVREGARYAAVLENPVADEAKVKTVVKSFGSPMGAPIKDSQISIALDSANSIVTVKVTGYTFSLVTPFAKTVGASSFSLTREATFRWERGGA